MTPTDWEVVAHSTYRLNVPGGWLYRHFDGCMAFVPQPPPLWPQWINNPTPYKPPMAPSPYYGGGSGGTSAPQQPLYWYC